MYCISTSGEQPQLAFLVIITESCGRPAPKKDEMLDRLIAPSMNLSVEAVSRQLLPRYSIVSADSSFQIV